MRLAPDQLFHAVLRLDPRATSLAPPGRGGDRELQPELIRQLYRVAEGVLPPGCHIDQALLDDLRSLEGAVEILQAAYADALHPFQILPDALFRDVAVHPVPPDTGSRGVGR